MKQKQSGFAHIMIVTVVLALGLVGALGYIYWQNFIQPKNSDAKAGTGKTIPATKTPAAKTDPLADWKTYTSSKFGFSFKYPSDWTVQESPAENGNSFPTPLPDILAKSPKGDDMRIWLNIKDGGWDYENDVIDIVRYTATPSTHGITLSDRTYYAGRASREDSLGYHIGFDFDYANNKYMVISTGDNPDGLDAGEKVFIQIISTWKFN